MNAIRFLATNHPFVAADVRRRIPRKIESIRLVTSAATVQARHAQIVFCRILSLILVLGFVSSGCANKAKTQEQIRRAYIAGEQAARAQMQQAQAPQSTVQPLSSTTQPQVRVLGAVKNPVLPWSEGLTLARALVEAEYEKTTAPSALTIFRNNEPLRIDVQQVLQGADYPLFPGDIVFIEN